MLNWDAANRHPRLAQLCVFMAGVIALGALAYFRFANQDFALSVLVGVLGGSVLVLVARRYQEDPIAASLEATHRRFFEFALAAIGLVLILVGALTTTLSLALTGVGLLLLGMVLLAIKRAHSRRS